MVQVLDLIVAPQIAFNDLQLRNYLTEYFGIQDSELSGFKLLRRSVDARNRNIKVNLRLEVFVNEPVPAQQPEWPLKDVSNSPEVHIVGAGPAGLFAALRLIELNFKPVILERGKDL